jgi:hypothetical protein
MKSLWVPPEPDAIENRHVHMINPGNRTEISCAYSDCRKPGWADIRIVKPSVQHQGSNAIYIFCSHQHKDDYLHERRGGF